MTVLNHALRRIGWVVIFANLLPISIGRTIAQVRVPDAGPIPSNRDQAPPPVTPAATENVVAASVQISSPHATLTLTDTSTQKDAAIRLLNGDVLISTVVRSTLSVPGRRPIDTSMYRELVTLNADGNMGLGTRSPTHRFSIAGGPRWTSNGWKGAFELENGAALAWGSNLGQQRFGMGHTNGGFFFFRTGSDPGKADQPAIADMTIRDDGVVSVRTLEITGADVAETFGVRRPALSDRGRQIEPGLVVAIDPEHPGELVVSGHPYERRVAGVISGAGDIQAGILLGQHMAAQSTRYPVAVSGRVYCWADTSGGAIRPGDLLTTGARPGYAMKVRNHIRAQGAILGKAMTSLNHGAGLVLVLVTLQ